MGVFRSSQGLAFIVGPAIGGTGEAIDSESIILLNTVSEKDGMVISLASGVAINVGVNTNKKWGGFRGPIYSDGSFEFIHIPWKPKYGKISPPPPKYSEKSYASYIAKYAPNYSNKQVLVSPDFCSCTYASTVNAVAANKAILNLAQGNENYLFFYATLRFIDEKGRRESWINSNWGAYVVGFFKVDFVSNGLKEVLSDKNKAEAFREYAWFRSLARKGCKDDGETPWVKGIKGKSGLLEKAIPLSRPDPEDPQRWSDEAHYFFTTTRRNPLSDGAVFQTVLRCEGKQLDELIARCILRDSCEDCQ